ncbi:universal stress protein PHOS34-like [Actinidia eriantha]|uniref:universal stress protein PHOS34-like n=1 Tax=Actinidia eriantha TaxID=165200 RepID=UPI00258C49EF|nr:universal stress protein PHOS34-like [Actinidia eriantha]
MVAKQVMVVGLDDSDHSFYALEWILEHFFDPPQSSAFKLVIVHARSAPTSYIGLAGPGAENVLPILEADLKRAGERVAQKAKDFCNNKSVNEVTVDVVEGDARNVMCDAVDKHHASVLVLGSHGYGAFKRAVLGSVSDYCSHHAHCSVMIVKKPKAKN